MTDAPYYMHTSYHQWESQSGKKYYSLNPDEKAEANREILAMLAAEKQA